MWVAGWPAYWMWWAAAAADGGGGGAVIALFFVKAFAFGERKTVKFCRF